MINIVANVCILIRFFRDLFQIVRLFKFNLSNSIATLTETFFAIYKRVRKLKSPIEKLDAYSE